MRVLFGASPQTVEGLEAQEAASKAALQASIKSDSTFVGRLQFAVDTRGERQYGEYARVAADPGLLERPSLNDVDAEARSKRAERAHSDMTEALKERDLRPSDCAGVLEASRAAGVSKILESGKYEACPSLVVRGTSVPRCWARSRSSPGLSKATGPATTWTETRYVSASD